MILSFSSQRISFCVFLLITHLVCFGQPSIASFSTKTGKSNKIKIDKPSNTQAGDLLVVGVAYEKGSDESITKPGGWTLIKKSNNSSDAGLQTFYKIAGSGEPSNYEFSTANGSKWSVGCVRIINYDSGNVIDAFGSKTGSGSNTKAPSITTVSADCLVLCYYTNKKDAHYSSHSSTTEIYDKPNTGEGQPSNMLATFNQTGIGATGEKKAVASESEKWVTQQVAIRFSSPLPVRLAFFTVDLVDVNKVKFEWASVFEQDNDYFEIQQSTDLENWKTIAEVEGVGHSSNTMCYYYDHFLKAPGDYYFRLKQVDYNGQFSFFNIKSVHYERFLDSLTLFPNPTERYLTLSIFSKGRDEVHVYDFSKISMDHLVRKIIMQDGVLIDLNRLPAGIYFVNYGHIVKRIVKQ